MVLRRGSPRPPRVLSVSTTAVVCAVCSTALTFSSLPGASRLRRDTVFRRQESEGAPKAVGVKKEGRVKYVLKRERKDPIASGDGPTCTARCEDGRQEREIDAATRGRPMQLQEGQRILVCCEGVWHAGKVLEVGTDGATCTVKYVDGSKEADIDVQSRVRGTSLSVLKIGSKLKGTVVSRSSVGVFVDIGAEKDGLVHVSQISHGYIPDVREYIPRGQEVDVWVAGTSDGKLFLSMLDPSIDRKQWLEVFNQYSPNQWITGIVQGTPSSGLKVELPAPDGRTTAMGWVHVTEIADEVFGKTDEIGQKVQVRVLDVQDGRISLSMKEPYGGTADVLAPGSLAPFAELPSGTWLKGKVARIVPFGLVVSVSSPDGVATADGLVHITQIRDGFVEIAEEEAEVGQEVDVRVRMVNVESGKMSLSMKRGGDGDVY